MEDLERLLRANHAAGWIRTVQEARKKGDDFALLHFTAFQDRPALLYVAAEYAARYSVPVMLAAADDDDIPQVT